MGKNIQIESKKILPLLTGVFIDYMNIISALIVLPALFVNNSYNTMLSGFFLSTKEGFIGFVIAIYYFGQLIGVPLIGTLSDRHGRKKLFVASLIGATIGCIFTARALDSSNILLLFAGRFITGFFAANIALAQSSIADISDETNKTGRLGLIEAAVGVGIIAGALLSGVFSDVTFLPWVRLSLPFWILACLALFNLGLLTLFFEETLVNGVDKERFSPFSAHMEKKMSLPLKKMLSIFGAYVVGWTLYTNFSPIFLLHQFNFRPAKMGLIFMTAGLIYAFMQITLVAFLGRHVPAKKLLLFSILGLSVPGIGLIITKNAIILGGLFLIYGVNLSITFPNLVSAISSVTSPSLQGSVIGIIWSIQAAMIVIGTLLGSLLVMTSHHLPIIAAGCVMIICWLTYLAWFKSIWNWDEDQMA